jgi:hypothetical protein
MKKHIYIHPITTPGKRDEATCNNGQEFITLFYDFEDFFGVDLTSVLINILCFFRPKSRGRVKLRSSNPYDKPIFYAGYFTHPDDMKVNKTCIFLMT